MSLPYSDAFFTKAYPAETTEACLDGHVSAFSFFGGVPQSILYNNTKLAVVKICDPSQACQDMPGWSADGTRKRTQAFTGLISHYLFSDRFGRPGKGNDKGKVGVDIPFGTKPEVTLRRALQCPKEQADIPQSSTNVRLRHSTSDDRSRRKAPLTQSGRVRRRSWL